VAADKEYIAVGRITRTQGNRGAVRVWPLTDFPERFFKMKTVRVSWKKGGNAFSRQFTVEEVFDRGSFFVIKFEEVSGMDEAVELRGGYLEVSREELVPLPEGSFYIFQIVGLKVYDVKRGFLGVVSDVLKTGANDVYVVETGASPLLIPALKTVVTEVDTAGGRMTVKLPEGLAD